MRSFCTQMGVTMADTKTMLIVDDVATCRAVLRDEFKNEFSILEAEDGEEAMKVVEQYGNLINVILLDIVMPNKDGFYVLQQLNKTEEFTSIPVIAITSDNQNEILALQQGAWDFMHKPVDLGILKTRVDGIVQRKKINDVLKTKKNLYSEQIDYLTSYDELTGIYNRKSFCTKTKELLQTNQNEKFVICQMDINRFKLINELFSHETGNHLLCYIADNLKDLLNDTSKTVYARMQMDVFAICMPYEKEKVRKIMEQMELKLKAYDISFEIIPSFGLYIVSDHEITVDLMCDRANLALKTIKGNYLTKFAYFDEKINNALMQEVEISQQMQDALNKKQFLVYLQPKCDLCTGKIVGAEALVRWQHPKKGLIAPNEFIMLFEQNGFIMKMDEFIWEEVCILLKKWQDSGKQMLPISVNVSRINLYNPAFCDILIQLVKKYQIPASMLEIELTESAYMNNYNQIFDVIKKLKAEGFSIHLDNFGSGYSSLNMLKEVPIDVLKVDIRTLVYHKLEGRGRIILEAITDMAEKLHLPIIMEGVENREEVEFLRKIGCMTAQGYYFARPMKVVEFEKRVHSGKYHG